MEFSGLNVACMVVVVVSSVVLVLSVYARFQEEISALDEWLGRMANKRIF